MARVHVETWKTTYRGIVPDDRLDALTVEADLAGGFGSHLSQPPPGWAQFVAVADSAGVVGFAVAHPNHEANPLFTGELGAVYVLRVFQARGVGSSLLGEATRYLRGLGHTSMVVWCLEQNPYRRFYEKLGGVEVDKRMRPSRIAGRSLPEVCFGWKDTAELAKL